MVSQLTLDLLADAPPTLGNFVAGRNLECLECLRAIARGARTQRFVYLWGAAGSGRSHLAVALAGGAATLGPDTPIGEFGFEAERVLYVADDVHLMDAGRQEALFHLFNRVQASGSAALVATGERPPLALPVREDLRTRLGWGLVYELQLLSDEEKAHAVRTLAADRGVVLADDVVPWLLTHRSRDIRMLLAEFDSLDRYALARKRPITLALVRDWLHDGLPAG